MPSVNVIRSTASSFTRGWPSSHRIRPASSQMTITCCASSASAPRQRRRTGSTPAIALSPRARASASASSARRGLQPLGVEARRAASAPTTARSRRAGAARAAPSSAASHTRRRLRACARTSVPASIAMKGSRVTMTPRQRTYPRNACRNLAGRRVTARADRRGHRQPRVRAGHPPPGRGRVRVRQRRQGGDGLPRCWPGSARPGSSASLMLPAADGLSTTLRRHLHARARTARVRRSRSCDCELDGSAHDSSVAAEAMATRASRAIVVLGGDGTHRVVAKACGDVAALRDLDRHQQRLPRMRETTVAGLATGLVATGRRRTALRREDALEVARRRAQRPRAGRRRRQPRALRRRPRAVAPGAHQRAVRRPSPTRPPSACRRSPARCTRSPRGGGRGLHVRLGDGPGACTSRSRPGSSSRVEVAVAPRARAGRGGRDRAGAGHDRARRRARARAPRGEPATVAPRARAADDRRRRRDARATAHATSRGVAFRGSSIRPEEERRVSSRAPEPRGPDQGAAARGLPRDAHHPRVRGAPAPRVRDRRDPGLRAPVRRRGGDRRRRHRPPRRRRLRREHAPRPRPRIAKGCDVQGHDGRDLRQADRHLPRQGRLDAHRRPRPRACSARTASSAAARRWSAASA